jgi:hypothetical protein
MGSGGIPLLKIGPLAEANGRQNPEKSKLSFKINALNVFFRICILVC